MLLLSVGIKYSVRDLLFMTQSSDMRHINVSAALRLASARLRKLWIPFQNNLLGVDLSENFFDFSILLSGFQSRFCHIHWFYPCRSIKHSNWWRHKL